MNFLFYALPGRCICAIVSMMGLWQSGNTQNVGIGTSTPDAKLEVAGNVKISGGSPGEGKVLTSDENGLAIWQPPPSPPGAAGSGTSTPCW